MRGDVSVRSRLRPPRAVSVPVVSAVLFVVLAVVVFANSWGVFQTDIKPEVYLAPQETLPRYLSAWTSSPYLGSPNFNVGLVPVLAVTAVLRFVGLSPEMAFKLYHLILWAMAAWGTNRLLRTLVPSASRWAGLLAGVAYIANPYAVAAGGTLAIALPMALLPWLLIAMTRALRDPSGWAWPAAVGLTFFAMSGMNVGVVPVFQLLLVIPLAVFVRQEIDLRWREVVAVLAKSALFVVVVSLYWLVPAAAATGTGSQIVEGSESIDGIAKVSSFVEVLRGLGLWSYYGSSDAGPWIPEYSLYFTSAVILLFTMLWPAAAMLSLKMVPARVARFAASAAAMTAVIMVGLYPGGSASSPFGHLLRWVFENVGPLMAFRTTNKIGAGLALVFALLVGLTLVQVVPRYLRRRGTAPIVGGLVTATLVALVAPAVTGNLYVSPMDVPDYWQEAAEAVDEGDPEQRALLLPGQTRSHYRWSLERPDDLPNSLFERDAVIPESIPNTSPSGGNFLAALDDTLQSGTAGSHDISPFARYLGVDHVLLRHDINWEDSGGARPGETARALGEDEGLQGLENFGQPGENMFTRAVPPATQEEAVLHPVQLYGVNDSRGMVRATPARGTLVVAGDAWSIPPLAQAGALDDSPPIRYAHDVSTEQLPRLLREGGRMVLTDTNQRREAITNRLRANHGGVLPADETPEITRALGEADEQSTLVREGVRARATSTGGAFFDLPYGVAENAIDGDPQTSWLFGDFRRAKGESLTLDLPSERELDEVEISTTSLGDVAIDALRVHAGDVEETVPVDEDGTATIDLGGVRTDEIRLTVEDLRGDGFSLVGVSEVDLGHRDLTAQRTIRTPDTFSRLYSGLSTQDRERFAKTPLDLSFTRVTNTPVTNDDSEQDLRRDFTMPDDRDLRARAEIRVRGALEPAVDELAGMETTYTARSSRTYFDSLKNRASQAADGSASTAWIPGGEPGDAWWQISGPERALDEITLSQAPGPGDEDDTAWATRVSVDVDGEKVATGRIGRWTSSIDLPEGTRGSTVRVTIDEVDDSAGSRPSRFTEIDTGARITGGDESRRCVTVATIDDKPLQMRPQDPEALGGTDGPATTWVGCGEESIVWGEHRLRPVEGFQLDGLTLEDVQRKERGSPPAPPVVNVERSTTSASMTVDVGPAARPYFLTIGQGHDQRWRATREDGSDLGPPVVVDGYAAGWYVDDLDGQTITIAYGPQTRANVALAVSGIGLLVASGIFLVPLARRRSAEIRAQRESEWEDEPAATGTEQTAAGSAESAENAESAGSAGSAERADSEDETVTPAEPAEDAASTSEDTTPAPTPAARRRPRPTRGLGRALTSRSGGQRLGLESALVVGAGLLTGIGGALAALAAMVLVRRRGPRAGQLIAVGAGLVLLSALVFLLHTAFISDTLGTVSADAVKEALLPHHIAGAGLVLAVLGTFMRQDSPEESDS